MNDASSAHYGFPTGSLLIAALRSCKHVLRAVFKLASKSTAISAGSVQWADESRAPYAASQYPRGRFAMDRQSVCPCTTLSASRWHAAAQDTSWLLRAP